MRPRLLISNDDGFDSPFLPPFAAAFAKLADIQIVVPAREHSWIGRAYSRHAELEIRKEELLGLNCQTLSGTPGDCVNIALAHLCKNPPDAVVSGLNIGQNVAMPLLWSSGTFSAAVEGAAWGIPAFAFSMRLDKMHYESCRLRHSPAPPELMSRLECASAHAASLVMDFLEKKTLKENELANVNYPSDFSEASPFVRSEPARAKLASLYSKNEHGKYVFSYKMGELSPSREYPSDVECLDRGFACCSIVKI